MLLSLLLAVAALFLFAGCGSDSDGGGDDNDNTGGALEPCDTGEERYYCERITTSIAGQAPQTEYDVIDYCEDDNAIGGDPTCPVTWSGNSFSMQCTFTEPIGDCTLTMTIDVSGTYTMQQYTASGDITYSQSGDCPFELPGSGTMDLLGTLMSGPGAPCGKGKAADDAQFAGRELDETTLLTQQVKARCQQVVRSALRQAVYEDLGYGQGIIAP